MNKQVDYLIVGQGLAGSTLAMECIRRGKKVYVVDEPGQNRASVISAGICNPITGRAMKKSWLADRLFPFLQDWYTDSEKILGGKFFTRLPVYRPFLSREEQQEWSAKADDETLRLFVERVWTQPFVGDKLNNPHGGLEVRQSGMLDVIRWVTAVREMLKEKEMYLTEFFDEGEVRIGDDVSYGDVRASYLIFCNGLAARNSKWFHWLPLRPLKGETLTLRSVSFPADKIISRGVYLVPANRNGVFVAGSTYEHEPFVEGTSEAGLIHLRRQLDKWIRSPYEVIHQDWGMRPAVTDRRPLLGSHPGSSKTIIFNGLGTKGVSLAPYFASVLIDWLDRGAALPPEVNISRFKALYSN